jgi:hypothetical protein
MWGRNCQNLHFSRAQLFQRNRNKLLHAHSSIGLWSQSNRGGAVAVCLLVAFSVQGVKVGAISRPSFAASRSTPRSHQRARNAATMSG